MDDEIDLTSYVRSVVKHWRIVRDALIVAVVAAFVATQLSPRVYEAVARVAIVKTRTQVTFDDKIRTLSPETAAAQSALAASLVDAKTRRNTLATLVENPRIAEQVVGKMGDRLPPSLRDPEKLLASVKGRPAKDADLVEITVRGNDPPVAAEIADSWATAYEAEVNRTYSQTGGSARVIEDGLAMAKAEYDKANEAFIVFIAENRDFEISSRITDTKKLIDVLQKGRQEAAAAILEKQTAAQAETIGRYVSAALGMAAEPMTREAEAQVQTLKNLYAAKLRNQQLLEDARTLRAQLDGSGASASSSALPLQLLKAQIASSNSLPSNLQLRLDNLPSSGGSVAEQVADLDTLIRSLELRQKELGAAIDKQAADLEKGRGVKVPDSSQIADGSQLVAEAQKLAKNLMQLSGNEQAIAALSEGSALTDSIDRLTSQIRSLEPELSRNNAKKLELTRARDLAREAHSSLASKAQEWSLSSVLPGGEVTFASPAARPTVPVGAGRSMVLGIAAVLGLFVGAIGALVLDRVNPAISPTGIPWVDSLRWVARRRRESHRAALAAGSTSFHTE